MRGLISAQESGGIAVGSARTELLGVPGGAVRSGPFLDAATERYQAIVLGAEPLGEQIARYEAIEAELNAEDDPDSPTG